jgi:hypothetical protein
MVVAWERRVRAGVIGQVDAPLGARVEAALLVARCHLSRWGRRAGLAVVVTTAVAAMAAGTAFALVVQAL